MRNIHSHSHDHDRNYSYDAKQNPTQQHQPYRYPMQKQKPPFSNMDNVQMQKAWKQFKRWGQERYLRPQEKDYYSYVIPRMLPDLGRLHHNREHTTITWIGHSTFLIQMGELNIVTDPVWADSMAFEKRISAPGIDIKDMPKIDIILLSHSHYDHLHLKSIKELAGAHTKFIVPAGLRKKMIRKGFENTHEMHWWEAMDFGKVRVSFVPAQHGTRRTLMDGNRSHWGGFVMEHRLSPILRPTETIYFAGDSGYFRGFTRIGDMFDIDVSLIPIGAYEPEWFMSPQHVSPEQAVQAFLDVKAKMMIPMHYGAFKLADDTPREAIDRLLAARDRHGITPDRIHLAGLGEVFDLSLLHS